MRALELATRGKDQRYRRIEVGARQRAEYGDKHHKAGPSREGVAEQRDGNVPAREALAHDAGANDDGEQQRCTERLRSQSPREIERLERRLKTGGGHELLPATGSLPMARSACLRASPSSWSKGRPASRSIRAPSILPTSAKARSISASLPSTSAGSGVLQCSRIGLPGQTGQTSLAALSQTVMTKSNSGAFGPSNSSHDFDRNRKESEPVRLQPPDRTWVHRAFRVGAGGVGLEPAAGDAAEHSLGQDRAGRVAGA